MTVEEHGSVTDEMLLRRESELRASTYDKRAALSCANAQRHLNEGLTRRHYMLQSSRLFLAQLCPKNRKEPLSPYEATDCAIHLNAYYLNLRGSLDNLAWILQYEWRLLAGVTEDRGDRLSCHLFGRKFLVSLRSRHPVLASMLDHQCEWAKDLTLLRDPAAHRIPIYVPPSVITSPAQVEEFRRIEALADGTDSEGESRPISEIYRQAQAVADFAPVMVISTPTGLTMRPIHEQLRGDHVKYLTTSQAVVDTLPNIGLQPSALGILGESER